MPLPNMNDAETAAHLRTYVAQGGHDLFSWPTDACGYNQHIRFVKHRNANWPEYEGQSFDEFVLRYADSLDGGVT